MCLDGTTKNPQKWYVIAPEILQRQYIDVRNDDWSWKIHLEDRIFSPDLQWDVWGKFARPALSAKVLNARTYSARTGNRPSKISLIESLSNELLGMILEHLAPEKRDIVALGLSSEYLWQIVFGYIHTGYKKSASPWAGKMIAFQGSYSTDLPEAFDAGMVEAVIGNGWCGKMCAARRFFWWHRDDVAPTTYSEKTDWVRAFHFHKKSANIPKTCLSTLEEELDCSYLFPADQEWLLRNLTTKEIVSSKLFGTPNNFKQGNESNTITFGDVLLTQTCWTNMPSDAYKKLDVLKGVWAGHRFDIVTLERHQTEEQKGEWSDVSEAVLEKVEELQQSFTEGRKEDKKK